MSNIKLQGNASGTGTTTVQSGNTNSDTTFTLPTADGTNGQLIQTNGSGQLSFVTGASLATPLTVTGNATAGAEIRLPEDTDNGSNYVAIKAPDNIASNATLTAPAVTDTIATIGTAQTFTAAQTFRASNAIRSEAASTQDAIVVAGRAGGTNSYALTVTPATLSASRTVTLPDGGGNYTVGYLNVPAVGTKTSSYTLATADVGKYVQVGTSGSITIPDATFAEGDVISIFNNTTGNITITCSITTAYIAGTDTDKATMTLATRGVATILFISSTVCVVSGNVT